MNADVPLVVPLMDSGTRIVFHLLALGWFVALGIFWRWWLRDEHYVDAFRFGVNCFVLFWTTFIPGYFIFIIRSAVVPNPALSVPRDWRVAMVVTKAPSEPFDIVRTTLLAMLDQTYPHDTWLADEDPSPETLDWCRDHGVFVSTRRGVAAYHRTSWPRRTGARKAISRTSTTGLATTTTISCRSSMPITCRPAPISRRCCGRSSIRQSATCRRRASATAMRP